MKAMRKMLLGIALILFGAPILIIGFPHGDIIAIIGGGIMLIGLLVAVIGYMPDNADGSETDFSSNTGEDNL